MALQPCAAPFISAQVNLNAEPETLHPLPTGAAHP